MGMWPQILQAFSPRKNNRWGIRLPLLLALGIGFIYILTRSRNNMGLQQLMKPIANMRNNMGMWQMMQPFTNIMKNRGIQEDLNQPLQYDGLAMNDEKTMAAK